MANTLEKALWLLLHESYLMSHQVQKTRLRPKYSNMCNRRNVLKAAMIFGNSILNQSKIFLAVLLQFFDFKPSWYTTLQLCNKYKDRVYQDIICSFEKSDNSQKMTLFSSECTIPFPSLFNTYANISSFICLFVKLLTLEDVRNQLIQGFFCWRSSCDSHKLLTPNNNQFNWSI